MGSVLLRLRSVLLLQSGLVGDTRCPRESSDRLACLQSLRTIVLIEQGGIDTAGCISLVVKRQSLEAYCGKRRYWTINLRSSHEPAQMRQAILGYHFGAEV